MKNALHITASNIMEYLKLENNIKPGFQEAGNVEG
jgi:hypothetical protein